MATVQLSLAAPASGQTSGTSRVVDEAGNPVEGARVSVQIRPHFPIPEEVRDTSSTVTGPDGSFSLPGSLPPDGVVVVAKEGFVTRGFAADSAPPSEVELRAGESLLGSVVTDKGTSIAGALVGPPVPQGQISAAGQRSQPLLFVRTDGEGNFVLPGVPTGRHEVLVQAPGVSPKLVVMNSGVSKRVVLETGGTTVTGTVRGSRDQLPQVATYVEASAPGIKLYTRTDDSGRYSFPHLGDREWQFRAVTPQADVRHPVQTIGLKTQEEPYEVNLMVSQGVQVSGLVFDVETSEPITDMTITLDTEPRRRVQTDGLGQFTFENVEVFADPVLRWDGIVYSYHDPASGDEKSYYEIQFPESGDATTLTLGLHRRPFISGRVVDGWNRPVPGAAVQARTLAGALMRRGKSTEEAQYSARSKADGTFKLLVAPAGRYEVVASKDQYVSELSNTETWTTAPADVTLALKPSASVSGMVLDAQEQPVVGATVEVRIAAEEASTAPELVGTGRLLRAVTSTDRGWFELTGFTPRKVDVVAAHPDYGQKATATVDLYGTTSSGLMLRFPGGNEFSAVVTRQDGGPVPGTEVRIFFTFGGQQRTSIAEADGQGRVAFKALPSRMLDRVLVRDPEYVEFSKESLSLPQTHFAIMLKPRGRVEVTVDEMTDPADPAQALSVLLMRASSGGSGEEGAAPDPGRYTVVEQRNADEGKATFERLEPGWYKAVARRGTLYAESDAVQLAESGPTVLSIVMEGGGQVRGRVVDKQTQQAIPGAIVSIAPAGSVFGMEPVKAVSSSDGTFDLAGVPAGAMELSVISPPYPDHVETVTVPSRGTIEVPVLLSNEKARLTGTVSYGGQGLSSALLVLHKPGEGESPVASAVSDDTGRYEFAEVPPGRYLMTVEGAGSDAEELRHKQFEVAVSAPESTKDVAFAALAKVTGNVRVEGLTRIPEGRALLFMPKDGGTAATVAIKAGGSFETALEPGTYSVGLDDSPGQDVTIAPAADKPQRLDLSF